MQWMRVFSYCQNGVLELVVRKLKNKSKTRIVIFSKGKVKVQHNFKMGYTNIDTDTDYCYLGAVFNFNGKFNEALEERKNYFISKSSF